MYLISSRSARLTAEILRYISGNVWQSQSWRLSRNSVSPAVWEDGGWGDPSDRAAALPEFRYCPLPRACNSFVTDSVTVETLVNTGENGNFKIWRNCSLAKNFNKLK